VRKTILRSGAKFLLVIVFTASLLSAGAQQGGRTTYVYDDNGRLHAVISPSGDAVVYEYDPAGNITAIRRLAADLLSIISFSPHEGLPGDPVTFIGTGFGGGVTDVSFNGASAAIVSVTNSKVIANVPADATTGLVTITTPTGSVTTTTPFTIAGLRITPAAAAIKFGETVQFTAEVLPSTLDQSVIWSVEGIIGGNSSIGTISASGLYTAPNTRFSALKIRATSVADNARFAEANVRVSDPNDVQSVIAASVSVQLGVNFRTSALAPPLAVQYGDSATLQSALAKPVAVQYGFSDRKSALASAVAVQYGDSADRRAALGRSVGVQYGTFAGATALTAVSATAGPYIQDIAPGTLTRGTSTSVTINGVGLTGTTALRFITAAGSIDTSITASSISVNAEGTSLTVMITVGASSALGNRIVVIATPNGDSIIVDLGNNLINVQ